MTFVLPDYKPSPDEWCMAEAQFHAGHLPHFESIFALANGYMGVRASLATNTLLGDPGFYVAGVYDRTGECSHEIVNLPCWLGLGINVDGFDIDIRKGELLSYRRWLDMRQGILGSDIVWRDAGRHTTRLQSFRLLHAADRHCALQWGWLTPLDYEADIRMASRIDGWCIRYASPSGQPRLADFAGRDLGANGILLETATRATKIRVAIATSLQVAGASDRQCRIDEDRVAESIRARAIRGQPLPWLKLTAVYTSRESKDSAAAAVAAMAALQARSAYDLFGRHAREWQKRWRRADVRIQGDERSQKGLRFSIFHLLSLAHAEDDTVSLAAKGLHGNGYSGLVFWDTEIYLLPFYIHVAPDAAKALLRYRWRLLADAKWNARAKGQAGAFYPWNSSLRGRERTWQGWQEHVGSDIAYAIDWYCRATGDRDFWLGEGAEVFLATAKYWQSRVERRADGSYGISRLTGPDEIHTMVDNNAYTNYLVKWHLRRAAELAAELRQTGRWRRIARRAAVANNDPAIWQNISAAMYLPFCLEHNIHEQFDGYFKLAERAIDRSLSRMQYTGPVQRSFRPTKVAQQADTVLMYFMFADEFLPAVRRAGYRYYEPRCSHTSSLSRCIYAAVAAQVGLRREAYRQFLLSAENDFRPGAEMESENGIHLACMGGTWLAAICGLAGIWVRRGYLEINPCLPSQWRRLSFSLGWQGKVVEVDIAHERLRLRASGGKTSAVVGGQRYEIGAKWRQICLRASSKAKRK